jgi:hypothetical protein
VSTLTTQRLLAAGHPTLQPNVENADRPNVYGLARRALTERPDPDLPTLTIRSRNVRADRTLPALLTVGLRVSG